MLLLLYLQQFALCHTSQEACCQHLRPSAHPCPGLPRGLRPLWQVNLFTDYQLAADAWIRHLHILQLSHCCCVGLRFCGHAMASHAGIAAFLLAGPSRICEAWLHDVHAIVPGQT